MDKKILVLMILLFCLSFVSADAISDYIVPSSVPLGMPVTATGLFADTNGAKQGFLCSFYFLDSTTMQLVKRATDQYTTSTGRITMSGIVLNEPLFKRGETYILRTECGLASVDANFLVGQLETIDAPAKNNFEYITNPKNTDTIFIWGSIIGIIVLLAGFFWYIIKRGK